MTIKTRRANDAIPSAMRTTAPIVLSNTEHVLSPVNVDCNPLDTAVRRELEKRAVLH